MSNDRELQSKDLNSISDQPETAQIYEELTEEALESVAGGKRYFVTEGGVIFYNGRARSTNRHAVTGGTIFHF